MVAQIMLRASTGSSRMLPLGMMTYWDGNMEKEE